MREDMATTTPRDAELWQRNNAPDLDPPERLDADDVALLHAEQRRPVGELPAAFIASIREVRALRGAAGWVA